VIHRGAASKAVALNPRASYALIEATELDRRRLADERAHVIEAIDPSRQSPARHH
jgi:hypothetical protein